MHKKAFLIEIRTKHEAHYIIETGATIRMAAKEYGVSKSTVHKDMIERLPSISGILSEKVISVLQYNKSIRCYHGGFATSQKYKKIREEKHYGIK
jgi:putative DeoR family transcriptional regulator (stage III sporulation protein D)